MVKQNKPKSQYTLQKIFLTVFAFAFVMQIIQNIYYFNLSQPHSSGTAAIVSWFLSTILAAFVWFVIYLTRRNRTLSIQTLFEVTLLALSTLAIVISLGWLTTFIQMSLTISHDQPALAQSLYFGLPFMVTLPLLVIIIHRLRRSNQW